MPSSLANIQTNTPKTKKGPFVRKGEKNKTKEKDEQMKFMEKKIHKLFKFWLIDFIIFYPFFYAKCILYPILDLSQKLMHFYHFLYMFMERWDSIPYLNSGITFLNNSHSVSSNPTNLNNPPFTLPSHFKPTLTWTSFLSPAHFYPLL